MSDKIFYRGDFKQYSKAGSTLITDAINRTLRFSNSSIMSACGTAVFISHKHEDLDDFNGFLQMLVVKYRIVPYIDSMDDRLPEKTCADTARLIKETMQYCKKFIFFATNAAIRSYWCNWELGLGDVYKYNDNNVAILPIGDSKRTGYLGNEYLRLYPSIVFCNGNMHDGDSGELVKEGYYVKEATDKGNHITPLERWLSK